MEQNDAMKAVLVIIRCAWIGWKTIKQNKFCWKNKLIFLTEAVDEYNFLYNIDVVSQPHLC